jgi:hypothetical protein
MPTFELIGGVQIAITERPISLYNIGEFLDPIKGRMLRSYEVMRMRIAGYEFGDWEINGIFWTATKVSCSLNCSWVIHPDGKAEPVVGGWDKTFMAWGVAVPS